MNLRHRHGDTTADACQRQQPLQLGGRETDGAGRDAGGGRGQIGLLRDLAAQQKRKRDYDRQRDRRKCEVDHAPTGIGKQAPQKHRPDRPGQVVARGGDGHRDTSFTLEPMRNVGDKRAEAGGGAEADQQLQHGQNLHRGAERGQRVARSDHGCRADQRQRDAEAVDRTADQEIAQGEADHRHRVGERGPGAVDAELCLHCRHDHDDRPHADIADRCDQQCDAEADPRVAAIKEVGGVHGLTLGGVWGHVYCETAARFPCRFGGASCSC